MDACNSYRVSTLYNLLRKVKILIKSVQVQLKAFNFENTSVGVKGGFNYTMPLRFNVNIPEKKNI